MDKKTRDCLFSLMLMLFGGVVLHQGLAIVKRAAQPPYRIAEFSMSPGMLPTVLGGCLVFFSILLLINTLRGEPRKGAALTAHLKTVVVHIRQAFFDADMQSMAASVAIMAFYTFVLLGNIPFAVGAAIFLIGLMLFLRSAKIWVILASSGASIIAIMLLFEKFFKTTLP